MIEAVKFLNNYFKLPPEGCLSCFHCKQSLILHHDAQFRSDYSQGACDRDHSELEGQEAGDASPDPLVLCIVGGQLQVEHEVSRVTGG